MTGGRVLDPATVLDEDVPLLGGKGKRLHELTRAGYAVPRWFAVSTRVFDAIRPRVGFGTGADSLAPEQLEDLAERLQEQVWSAPIDDGVLREITRAYAGRFSSDEYVAVRSSATTEDDHSHSFAGQLESFLFVRGEDRLIRAIRGCWASVYSPRSLAYHQMHGLDPSEASVAVIVQSMVDARVSGVMFTQDPVTGDPDTLVIAANFGLGVSIVDGSAQGDTYRVQKGSGTVSADVTTKDRMVSLDRSEGQGTAEMAVPAGQREAQALSPKQLSALIDLGLRIERQQGSPQDIEWAVDGDAVFILQARPISSTPPGAAGETVIWDNSNIVESYPGVTTPLTFSFAKQAYSAVYRQVAELAGVSQTAIAANADAFDNMIGLIDGRVYYNLNNWLRGLSLIPGINYNKGFMEQMMGVGEEVERSGGESAQRLRKYLVDYPRLGFVGLRMLYLGLTVQRRIDAFEAGVDQVSGEYERRGFRHMSLVELADAYTDLQQRLSTNWKAPLINDHLTMWFYGVLRKLVTRYGLGETGTVLHDLLRGQGEMSSTAPAKAIMRMAAAVRSDPDLLALFKDRSDAELGATVFEQNVVGLSADAQDYLDRYGNRCVQELKLEEPSLRDDPAPLFASIRRYLEREDLDLEAIEAREGQLSERATSRALDKLKWRSRIPTPSYFLFKWVARRARRHIRDRENMRFARARVFGVGRSLFNEMGAKLHAEGLIDDPRDVFYLDVHEAISAAQGRGDHVNLRDLAAPRKAEFQRYRQMEPPPDRIKTVGGVRSSYTEPGAPGGNADDPGTLRGLGCCAGTAAGRVRVIASPREDRLHKGEILVARETDPGWVSLFPLASGLLIERGSALSHSAVVARELGIPTIVGIPRLTKRVTSGQWVEMDGARGEVAVIAERGGSPS